MTWKFNPFTKKLDYSANIVGVYQPIDAALTNISALVYVSPSFIKLTADDTYAVRTLAETIGDLSGVAVGTFSFNSQDVTAIKDLTTTGNTTLPASTTATPSGIIYKGADRFISNFNYGNNGTVTTQGQNTFVGINAGNFTMGSTATGAYHASYNTGIGAYSLQANTTGYRNTANGYQSLYSNTTGHQNTALGMFAGRYQSDGTSELQTPESSTYLGYNTKSGCTGNAAATCDTFVNDTGIGGGDDGTYNGIATTTTEGNGDDALTVDVTIAAGVISNVVVNVAGTGYRVNDTVTITGLSGSVVAANDDGTFDIATVGAEDAIDNEIVIGYNAIGNGSNTVTLGNDSVVKTYLKGTVISNGGQTHKKTNVADANYGTSALTTDYIVAWTSLSAARTATISTEDEDSGTAALPRVMTFKDQTGSAASYNITISLESGGNIDGAATYVLNKPYQFVVLEIDGTNAYAIGGS